MSDFTSTIRTGLSSYMLGHSAPDEAKTLVTARRLLAGKASAGDLREAAAFWADDESRDELSKQLMGGEAGKAELTERWAAYKSAQETELIRQTLATAKASPMRGLGTFSSVYGQAQADIVAWSKQTGDIKGLSLDDYGDVLELEAAQREQEDKLVVIPLKGTLMSNPGFFALMFGAGSYELFEKRLHTYAEDETVQRLVVTVDSPGGDVLGVAKAVDAMRYAANLKPLEVYIEGQCDSCAYWIASQGKRIVSARVSEAGSLGVYAPLLDVSKQEAEEGREWTWVRSGDKKARGQRGEEVDDELVADLRRRVDEYFEVFVADVAQGRGLAEAEVRSRYGDGATYGASQALNIGLIDEIVEYKSFIERS